MNEVKFKIEISFLAKLKYILFYIIAVAIIIFSVYKFEVNERLFLILIITAICLILFAGLKEVLVYDDYIKIRHKSLIPIPFLNKKFYFKDIKEFEIDLPNRVAELIITKQDPTSIRYKLIILFKEKQSERIYLEVNREDLEAKIILLNERVSDRK